MARKSSTVVPPQPKLKLTSQEIDRGIARLSERIAELHAFDLGTVRNGNTPELKALEVAIKDSLTRCFGEDTSSYRTYLPALQIECRDIYKTLLYLGDQQRNDIRARLGLDVTTTHDLLSQMSREGLITLEHRQPVSLKLSRHSIDFLFPSLW